MPSTTETGKNTDISAGTKRRIDFVNLVDDDDTEGTPTQNDASASNTSSASKRVKSTSKQSPLSFPPATSSSSLSSPAKTRPKTAVAVVTPGETDGKQKDVEFVPVYIHKNVGYHTEGKASLSETTKQAFMLIRQTHEIPIRLQSSTNMYGPLSGSSYEERVLQRYSLDQLNPKPEFEHDPTSTKICIACAEQGHVRDDCPGLI